MTTTTELRELLAKATLPPNEATAKLIRALPALLEVAEAAKNVMNLRGTIGYSAKTKAYDNMMAALSKLENAK